MSVAQRANVDVKKVDYITDWESERDDIKQQLAPVGIDSDKVLENVDKWEHWPQPVMNIIGRTEGGTKVHIVNDEIRPYFYVPMAEYDSNLENDSKVQDVEFGFSNPEGDNMVKVYTRIPGDVPKLRDEYTHHEADILFPNRFLIDAGIEGSISIPAEHANPVPSRVTLDEIEPADYNQKTRICFCDIEVDDSHGFPDESRAEEQVISITVYDNYTEEYLIFLYHPDFPEVSHPEAEVILFESELGMLKSFCEYLNRKSFDMITGWNFTDFDMRYLVNRIDLLDSMNSDIDICKEDLSILRSAYDEGYYGAKVKGISVFDMLRAYKNSKFSEADSYSLENVAQEELGEGKIQDNRGIFELWENNPQKLVDYNVKDVKLTVKLEQQQEIIKFFEEIANYVGGRPVECVDASKACDIKLLRTVHGEWAVPSSGQVDGEEFEGGQVFDPITGVRHNVIVLDLKSLYPMSMKTLNAGINTKAEDGALTAPNGISFTTERKAVVVDIIDELLEEREEYKKIRDSYENGSKQYKIYDRKQGAVKIVMNTLYGMLGWDRFRLYDEETAAAVTATGRDVIKFTKKSAEDEGYEVIYGDTDSIMLELGEDVTKEEAIEIGYELEEHINNLYDEYAKEKLNADEHWFQIEFEKLYRRYFQAGKKKRYAGHIVYKEGDHVDKTDTVGFETERSDYSKFAKDTLEKTLSLITQGATLEELHNHITSRILNLERGNFELDYVGIPSSVSKAFDEYDTKTPGVRGSEYANEHLDGQIQPGDKPKKMFVERNVTDESGESVYPELPSTAQGEKFICFMNEAIIPEEFEWDWETYVDKQIKGPHKRVLEGTRWTWNEILTGKEQPRLDDYQFEDRGSSGSKELIIESDEEDEEDEIVTEVDETASAKLDKAQDLLDRFEDRGGGDEKLEIDMSEKGDEKVDLDTYL